MDYYTQKFIERFGLEGMHEIHEFLEELGLCVAEQKLITEYEKVIEIQGKELEYLKEQKERI